MSRAVELCQKLIRFNTVDSQTTEALNFLASELKELGFDVERLNFASKKGRVVDNLYATIGEGRPHLLFSGHMDVVPVGDEKAWRFPPFEGILQDGILYGRGACDMKGGIACFVTAVQDFLKTGVPFGKMSLLITGDEEEPLVEATKLAMQVLVNRNEKFDFCLVGEPSSPHFVGQEMKVGRRGDVVFKITSRGEQGHTAYVPMDKNPVHALVRVLNRLQEKPLDSGTDFFVPSSVQITTIDVGNPASNIVPATAYATVDVRFNNLHTGDSLHQKIQKILSETAGNFDLEVEKIGEAFVTEPSEETELLQRIIHNITGHSCESTTGGGTSDARFIKEFCKVVEFGLPSVTLHKVNECVSVADIEQVYKIYEAFLEAYFTNIPITK